MALTEAGVRLLAQALVGTATVFNNTNAMLGVGDGSNVFIASQTDLQGANKLRKAMDTGYPKVEGSTVVFKSTFEPSEANFAWHEWGVFNAATGGVMLNRAIESNGTKQDNQTWVLEVAVTLSASI